MSFELNWMILVPVILVLSLAIYFLAAPRYVKVKSLLTPAEKHFYNHIISRVPERYVLLPKIRMADILQTKSGGKKALYKTTSKHADFVIADKATLEPLVVIELDDKSHNSSKTKERDAFVNRSYTKAGLGVLRVKCVNKYDVPKIINAIESTSVGGGNLMRV